jgi:serine/threonine-protein kinase
VTDFGIARLVDSTSLTAVGQVVGTAQYMSPEQASGEPATSASDIYSLGVVGYEMLAGKPAFSGENPLALAMAHVHQEPPDLPNSVPAGVRSLIKRSMSKKPVDRPASAAIFATEARDMQRHLLPSSIHASQHSDADLAPTVASTAAVAAVAPTAFSAAGPSETAVMPPGLIAGASPPILDRDFVRQARSKRRLIASAVVLVAALVIGLALAQATDNKGPLTAASDVPASLAPSTTVAATSTIAVIAVTPTLVTVIVDPNALLGLDKKKATDQLRALGLTVVTKEVKGRGNVERNTVVGVEPSGQLAPGSTVTLLIAGKKNSD